MIRGGRQKPPDRADNVRQKMAHRGARPYFAARNPTMVQAMAINAATSDSPATKPDAIGMANEPEFF